MTMHKIIEIVLALNVIVQIFFQLIVWGQLAAAVEWHNKDDLREGLWTLLIGTPLIMVLGFPILMIIAIVKAIQWLVKVISILRD